MASAENIYGNSFYVYSMVSTNVIKTKMSELSEMSDRVTFDKRRDETLECDVFVLDSHMVTATLREFDSGDGVLEMEYRSEENGPTYTETLDVPDEVNTVDVYKEEDTPRMVVNMDDYGF